MFLLHTHSLIASQINYPKNKYQTSFPQNILQFYNLRCTNNNRSNPNPIHHYLSLSPPPSLPYTATPVSDCNRNACGNIVQKYNLQQFNNTIQNGGSNKNVRKTGPKSFHIEHNVTLITNDRDLIYEEDRVREIERLYKLKKEGIRWK